MPAVGKSLLIVDPKSAFAIGELANSATVPAATAGKVLVAQGTTADPAFKTVSGDATLSATGVVSVPGVSVSDVIADPGNGAAIPVTRSGTIEITTAAAETNSLAVPTFEGQHLTFVLNVRVGGNRVITSSARINTAGDTVITLDTAGDAIELVAIKIGGVFRWQVRFNDGATLS